MNTSEPSARAGGRFALRRRLLSVPTLASFAVAAALLVLLFTRFSIDVGATWQTIRQSNPWLYLVAIAVHYTTFLFRGARWRLLLKNAAAGRGGPLPSTRTAARLILLGWFASCVTWFRLGDVYRAYAHAEESGSSLSRTAGTVVAERVLDVVVVFLLLLMGFLLMYADPALRPSGLFLLVGFGLLVAAGLVLLAMRLLRTPVTRFLPARIRRAYGGFHEATMGSFRLLPWVMTLGILGWLAEVGRLFFVVQATGLEVGMGLILFVTMAHALLSSIPLTPGGLGIAEAGMVGLLTLSLPREAALSVVLLDRSISYLSILPTGVVALAHHQRLVSRRARDSAPWPGSDKRAAGGRSTPP